MAPQALMDTDLNKPTKPVEQGFAPVNGIQIFYQRYGTAGPWLVLVEGLGVATWFWEKQIPALAPHVRLVVFDNRGVGRSSKPDGPYRVQQMAEDTCALLDVLNVEAAALLGYSLGGLIAQEVAFRYPERVTALILAATLPGGPLQQPISDAADALLREPAGGSEAQLRRRLALAFSPRFVSSPEFERQIQLRLADPQPREAFQAQLHAGATYQPSGNLKDIHVKTLILASKDDELVPLENARRLHQHIPHSQLIVYQGVGHQFHIEKPAQFNRDVLHFLGITNPEEPS